MTLTRIRKPTPNQATRNGTVRLIVLHITAGALTNESLYNFISQSSAQVSYHVSVDNGTPNTCFWYVEEKPYISWSVASYNQVSVNGCICAPGEAVNWTRQQWLAQGNALSSLAQWVAEVAKQFSIPLVALTAAQAQGSGRGICQHRDLGTAGGGHSDCGPNFPMDELIRLAGGSQPGPSPKPPPFPYPADNYIGQPSPDPKCHSGCYGGSDEANCRTWQAQMSARGWTISVDGCYGPQSAGVCRSFQSEKGLAVDGLVGPQTWGASWTAPVT